MTAPMPLSYWTMNAGLTNQKLALMQLVRHGKAEQRPLVLPSLSIYSGSERDIQTVPIEQAFDEEVIREHIARLGISLVDLPDEQEVERVDPWPLFRSACNRLGSLQPADVRHSPDVAFLADLRPSAVVASRITSLVDQIAAADLRVGCQLRIEADWQEYLDRRLLARTRDSDDDCRTVDAIVEKLRATFPEVTRVYAVYNAHGLPMPEPEMKQYVQDKHGVRIYSKSDFEPPDAPNFLDNSIIDFEVALTFPTFVGSSRSTFANFVSLVGAARRTRPEGSKDYIYNMKSPLLAQRADNGLFVDPEAVTASPANGASSLPAAPRPEPQEAGSEPATVEATPHTQFYKTYSGTPTDGWSADFVASNRLFGLLQEGVEEIFPTSLVPVSRTIEYYDYLRRYHERHKGGVYCEIGVNTGDTLALARGARLAIGVDPAPKIKPGAFEDDPFVVARVTSDDFFANYATTLLDGADIDFCFLDGLHIFEFALRDFIGAERLMHQDGTIIVHDVLPRTDTEAARVRFTRSWTGDVWRLVHVLKRYRPDLTIKVIDPKPTGIAIITGFDPGNTNLIAHYDEVVTFGRRMKSSEMMKMRNTLLDVEPAT